MNRLAAPSSHARRSAFAAAAIVVLVVSLGALAAAQVPQPTLTMALQETTIDLGASNSTSFNGTVSYAESAPEPTGTATATVTVTATAPAGWTVAVVPATAFQIAPGEELPFTVTLTAPAAGAGDATGSLSVDATAAGAGNRGATASGSVTLTRIDPPPPVVTPFYLTPLGLSLEIGIPLLLVAGAVVMWRRNVAQRAAERAAADRAAYLARETGIVIAVEGAPREYGHRREVMVRLALQNVSDRPRVALVEVVSITNGWRAATGITRVPLASGERSPVTLVVAPDTVITPGDRASVVVRTRPEEAVDLDERVTIDIVAPKSGVPKDDHYKIVTVHREGANKGTR